MYVYIDLKSKKSRYVSSNYNVILCSLLVSFEEYFGF